MACYTTQLPGGGVIITCTRERKRRCYSCSAPNASLSCDGCDHVLCTNCAVSPAKDLDFCPSCFTPAFEYFKANTAFPRDRAERRQAFRVWARANAFRFLELAKARTKKSLEEVPGVHVDAPATVDPMTPGPREEE